MDIGELIEHHEESVFLDFKREEYHAENKPELIKDVLAFANASYTGDRFIIIGIVKDHKTITVVPVQNPQDAATIQQYIHDNITPELIVTYTCYQYHNGNIMVLTISGTEEQPYYASKPLSRGGKTFLRENDLWIRKGCHKVLGGREDLEKIYARRYAKVSLEGKIGLTFKNGTQKLELNIVKDLIFPSQVNKAQIKQQIAEKEVLYNTNGRLYLEMYGTSYPGDDSNAYESMDLRALRQRLETVELNFAAEDKYYFYEQRADKLQLIVNNTGTEYLKDILIELIFPPITGLTIADRIYPNTQQQVIATGMNHNAGYPKVVHQKDRIIVSQILDEVRHKVPAEVFIQPLRIAALEEAKGKEIRVVATINASNLPNPQHFELFISFK